ncbi:hypothetical protein Y695_01752 [Hydrogenophaga sp. T4]|nr:hypothetical protein Y695_01752 [Hydrogenophaga sp. T4]
MAFLLIAECRFVENDSASHVIEPSLVAVMPDGYDLKPLTLSKLSRNRRASR